MKVNIYGVFVMLFFGACTSGFEDTNTNPNLISEISPGALLNEIIYNQTSNNLRNHYFVNCELMQVQLAYPKYYGGVQRYEILESTGTSQWNSSYKWLKNIREMILTSEQAGAVNYKAIGLTLNAWIYSNLTDNFGSIPFSEASQSDEGIIQPKYDSQKEIYTKILADLEEANLLYDHSISMVYGTDILFGNDSKLWQKFTNSLRLRLLLRISDVDPSAYQKMVNIISDPENAPIMESLDESAILQITGVTPNLSPWSRPLDFSNQHAVGKFFIDVLNELEDPRRSVYVTPAMDLDNNPIGYEGIPSGYDQERFDYSPSYMNNAQVVAPMIAPIMSYSEVSFIKAELAQKGYLSSPAEEYFKEGVNAALELWTGQPADASYFERTLAQYNGSLERIMLHKYLALYFTDFQQWSEYRRTGFPVLPTTESMLNDGIMPSRLMYTSDQKTYNPKNYDQALEVMGGDDINFKVWWDKE
ncbi:SusD/RagB family nutrient-binding outer membrane lipoprotein [Echinicola strongylocentroti]|uniref:SusD/RagB family nutrient-binding outer membrane lipoprotein n=1 Tax=Echinicola strongylocentroti TaxID=1795355 RepID=A0A2Z4IEZ1_9BACT|nr:SusD/RagB family nutrient-binding outer membrane lipoprotein [Echinicola strongylocentroti]AWW29661.1 SusD/RagB family nutrient-binding outer membrane lipoprotein [Echinicola strongylocentroti]